MALEILDDVYYVRHALRHDLESIFYVLVWLCHTQSGPNGAIRSFNYTGSEIYRWNTCEGDRSSPRSISETKAYVLKDNDGRNSRRESWTPLIRISTLSNPPSANFVLFYSLPTLARSISPRTMLYPTNRLTGNHFSKCLRRRLNEQAKSLRHSLWKFWSLV